MAKATVNQVVSWTKGHYDEPADQICRDMLNDLGFVSIVGTETLRVTTSFATPTSSFKWQRSTQRSVERR